MSVEEDAFCKELEEALLIEQLLEDLPGIKKKYLQSETTDSSNSNNDADDWEACPHCNSKEIRIMYQTASVACVDCATTWDLPVSVQHLYLPANSCFVNGACPSLAGNQAAWALGPGFMNNMSRPSIGGVYHRDAYLRKMLRSKWPKGNQNTRLTYNQEEQLVFNIRETYRHWDRHIAPVLKRKNYLNTSYVCRQLVKMLELSPEIQRSFPLLKSNKRLASADAAWQMLCTKMDWPFVPLLPEWTKPIKAAKKPKPVIVANTTF